VAHEIKIINNISAGNSGRGIRIEAGASGGPDDAIILHNTVYKNVGHGILFQGAGVGMVNMRCVNNIVASNGDHGIRQSGSVTYTIVDYNDVVGNVSVHNIGANYLANNISVDPVFLSTLLPSTNFLKLSNTSPSGSMQSIGQLAY